LTIVTRGHFWHYDEPMEPTRKKPTIKDIARETGVSATTVLNVLGGRVAETSTETAERVRQKARELGYVRNLTAAALTGRGSHSFALIITKAYQPLTQAHESDINPYYGEFIIRLEYEARKAGLTFSLFGGDEEDYLNFVLERNLDAAVLMGIHRIDLPRAIAQRGVPVILLDSAVHEEHAVSIRTNDLLAGELAARYLLAQGRRAIGFVGDIEQPPDAAPSQRRLGAFRVCREAGIELVNLHCIATVDDGRRAATELVRLGLDSVITAADNLAAGIVSALPSLGKQVPRDVAVVGYDNLLIARLAQPPLTTIDQGLGEKVRTIIAMIKDRKPGSVHLIEPKLVVRESA